MFNISYFKFLCVFAFCIFIPDFVFAQSNPACTSNWINRGCSSYPVPDQVCVNPNEGEHLISGPNQSGTYSWTAYYCQQGCNGHTNFAGYYNGKCNYMSNACPEGQSWVYNGTNFSCVDDECPFGDCEGSSSSSSSTPICVPPYYYDPIVDDCVLDDGSSSASSDSSSSTGDSGSSASSSSSSGDNGGGASSSPGNPVPPDSTCPNKFQIDGQWYCQSNPMPSSDGQASSDATNAAVSGSCDSAPVCDGDPVGCAILLNAFFDRCNTDKNVQGGGDCSSEPVCSGDPVGCSIALQNWMLRCDQFGEPVDGDVDFAEYDSNFDLEFGEDNQASVDSEGALSHLSEVSNVVDFSSIDMSGLNIDSTGRSAQCPPPRTISLSVGSYEMSYQPLCDFAEALSSLVVLMFTYISIVLIWQSTQNGG